MKNEENKKYIKLGITGIAVLVVSMLCFFLLFRLNELATGFKIVAGILAPFIYGAVIAYILTPICNKIEGFLAKLFPSKKGKGNMLSSLSILFALLFALALIALLVMMVFPQVGKSIITIANTIPGQIAVANSWLHDLLKSQPDLQSYWDEFSGRILDGIAGWLKTDLLSTMETVLSGLGTQLALFFSVVKNLFLGILISIYFLISRKQFAAQGKMLLNGIFSDRVAKLIEEEVRYADKMFNGFLMAKLLDSAIIGIICFVGTALLGIKSAALVSVVVGVTNIIPFFGPFLGIIPCAILLLLENPMHCVYFVIFVVILQQIDGNVLGPRIMGNSIGLSSFWVLFSILFFGGLWGLAGMIVGVPLFAVIYDIVRRLIFYGLKKHDRGEVIEEYENTFHPAPVAKEAKKK